MSQSARILDHLRMGLTLTPAQAYALFGTLALHSRIAELRGQGHRIGMETISKGGKRYGEYRLLRPTEPQQIELIAT